MERDHGGQNRETQWREIMRDRTGRHNGERSWGTEQGDTMERDHEGQNRETQWREIMRDRTGRQNGERS